MDEWMDDETFAYIALAGFGYAGLMFNGSISEVLPICQLTSWKS